VTLRIEDVLLASAAREAEREERRDGDQPEATSVLQRRALLISLRRARLLAS
jgi:hypothetical protein